MLFLPIASFSRAFYYILQLLAVGLLLAPLVAAVPHPILPSLSFLDKLANGSTSASPRAVTFAVPCPGCFHGAADAALPFELVHEYSRSPCDNLSLTLNGEPVVIDFQSNLAQGIVRIPTADRSVDLSIQGYCDQAQSLPAAVSRQVLFFDIDPLDGISRTKFPSFIVVLNASTETDALVIPHPTSETQCLSLGSDSVLTSALFPPDETSLPQADDYAARPVDAHDESHGPQASPTKELRVRFDEERKLIRRLTMDCQRNLLDELRDCKHDVACSGKAICHHLHDALMNIMANLKSSLQQSPMVSDERQWQAIVTDDKAPNYGTTSSDSPSTSNDPGFDDKKSIVILILEILAGFLGLAGLCACIRRHCRSFRRRTERLADREERRRALEYRCLAQREEFRKKWIAVKRVFTRFPCRKLNCEEKQALVLEAASFAAEQPLTISEVEQAWDSTVARNLAQYFNGTQQEYLASLAEASISSQHYKHGNARSRSDSLPSYESEKLPDYSSQPGSDMVVANGFGRAYSPSLTGSSANTAITPDSSVPDLSPRCSHETLRTLMSRD